MMALDHYVTLGRSGLRVSPFCLGCMTFGDEWAAVGNHEEGSLEVLSTYLEAGGNFIDTANIYTHGHSEAIIGDYFAGSPVVSRDRVVIATKFAGNMHPGDPNGGGAGRKAIVHQLEEGEGIMGIGGGGEGDGGGGGGRGSGGGGDGDGGGGGGNAGGPWSDAHSVKPPRTWLPSLRQPTVAPARKNTPAGPCPFVR